MYFRHLYATVQPTLEQRCESWDNYCALFNIMLSSSINMQAWIPAFLIFQGNSFWILLLTAYDCQSQDMQGMMFLQMLVSSHAAQAASFILPLNFWLRTAYLYIVHALQLCTSEVLLVL